MYMTLCYLCHWCPCPQGELPANLRPAHLLPPKKTFQDQQVGVAQPPMKSLPLPWVLVHMRPCVCVLQEWSLSFPQFCGALAIKSHWPSKLNTLGALFPDSRPLGYWDWHPSSEWGSELSLMWENFCNLIALQFVENPGGMAFDYIASVTLLPPCFGFFLLSLDIGDLFW